MPYVALDVLVEANSLGINGHCSSRVCSLDVGLIVVVVVQLKEKIEITALKITACEIVTEMNCGRGITVYIMRYR